MHYNKTFYILEKHKRKRESLQTKLSQTRRYKTSNFSLFIVFYHRLRGARNDFLNWFHANSADLNR